VRAIGEYRVLTVTSTESADAAAAPAATARTETAAAPSQVARRLRLALLGIPLAAILVLNNIGNALFPALVDDHPAALLLLNPHPRNVVLVSISLDPLTHYAVGTLRLLAGGLLFFAFGRIYGDAAVTWLERRTRSWGEMLRWVEQRFRRVAYPLIFLAYPLMFVSLFSPICLLAGAARIPIRRFIAVLTAGTLTSLFAIRRFGETFESPIDSGVSWIGQNRTPLLVLTVALVLLSVALEAKRGGTKVGSLARLDEELDEAEREPERSD
jgi:membrane protein DedA with SNARE-associated domain